MIPKANESIYFRRFILKNVRHEEIEVQGFDVIVREVEKQAFLSLERDILGMPVLVMEYKYGNQYIPGWSSRKALVELYTEGDRYAFYKVSRIRNGNSCKPGNCCFGDQERYGRVFPFAGSYCG